MIVPAPGVSQAFHEASLCVSPFQSGPASNRLVGRKELKAHELLPACPGGHLLSKQTSPNSHMGSVVGLPSSLKLNLRSCQPRAVDVEASLNWFMDRAGIKPPAEQL